MAPHSLTIKKQRSQDHALVREVVADRRRSSIKARGAESAKHRPVNTKYPKQDILYFKEIFDAYDIDRSGFIEKAELKRALQREKDLAQRFDGSVKDLAARQAERGMAMGAGANRQGVWLVDFTDSLFRALDTDHNKRVDFGELLRVLYPYASRAELSQMLLWAADEPPPLKLEDYVLTAEQRREIYAMFLLYDKDRSGAISPAEFRQAMARCGLDDAECAEIFAEADADDSEGIDFAEFTELMRRTLFNGEELTPAMLYGPMRTK